MRHLTLSARATIAVVFAVATVQPVAGSDWGPEHQPTEHASVRGDLGHVDFASSGAPEAQPAFLRGLLLLHSFEYLAARCEFQKAEELDPSFAMAVWGEALTYNHTLWNEQDTAAARAAMATLGATPEARVTRGPTARERDYLASL